MAEFGIIAPRGVNTLKRDWMALRLDYTDKVPKIAWAEFDSLYSQLLDLHQQILAYDRKINALNKQDDRVTHHGNQWCGRTHRLCHCGYGR